MTLARTTDERGVCWRLRATDWGVVLDKRTPSSKRWRWVVDVASEERDLGRDRDAAEQELRQTVAGLTSSQKSRSRRAAEPPSDQRRDLR